MGVAATGADGTRGTLAYVFIERLDPFAERHHASIPTVLCCAIAHELGHLLLPVNAHTRDGIMRAAWGPGFLPSSGVGLPGFSEEQRRLLRRRIADRLEQ